MNRPPERHVPEYRPSDSPFPRRVDLVVLDIAGTTVEENGAVYVALEAAVIAAGGVPISEDIQRWMGADKHEAVAALLVAGHPESTAGLPDAARVEATYQDFRARLDQAYRDNPPAAIDGVPAALATLREHGVKVALTTGFTRQITDPLLARLGWDETVLDAVITVDDVSAGRPAPYMIFRAMEATAVTAAARVLVAGDTVRDLEAGTNAGAGFVVGVLTGGQSALELGAVRHTHILSSVRDIVSLVL